MNSAHGLIPFGAFEQVTSCSDSHGCKDRIIIVEQSEHQNIYARIRRKDVPCCLDAVDARHIEIHEDDIRLERGRQGDGFVSGRRLTDYLGRWLCL